MANWYHLDCILNAQKRSRTWKITGTDQLTGFGSLSDDDQKKVADAIAAAALDTKPPSKAAAKKQATLTAAGAVTAAAPARAPGAAGNGGGMTFAKFCSYCDRIAADPSSLAKSAIVSQAFQSVKGDVPTATLLVKLLLPGKDQRVYNMQDKTIGRLLARIFSEDAEEMQQAIAVSGYAVLASYTDWRRGGVICCVCCVCCSDVSVACEQFFAYNTSEPPQTVSTLTLQDVDAYLDEFTAATKEPEQLAVWSRVAVRLIAIDSD